MPYSATPPKPAMTRSSSSSRNSAMFFFFQAEDGIRDVAVTGVQTCALPILDGVADQVCARGPARLDSLRRIYGDKIATKVTVPTETITEGLQRIDGVTYDFKQLVD